jgi:hypothetical protein
MVCSSLQCLKMKTMARPPQLEEADCRSTGRLVVYRHFYPGDLHGTRTYLRGQGRAGLWVDENRVSAEECEPIKSITISVDPTRRASVSFSFVALLAASLVDNLPTTSSIDTHRYIIKPRYLASSITVRTALVPPMKCYVPYGVSISHTRQNSHFECAYCHAI